MARKPRAINLSANDKKKILAKHEEGMKPSAIEKYYEGKYTYFQIYNTINPGRGTSKVDKDGNIIKDKVKADKLVTGMPDVDVSDFVSIEKFIEHQITVIVTQLNDKNLIISRRVWLLKEITKVNIMLKKQLIENHLKNANARLVISIMRRLKPELTDEELLTIFKEESERNKKLNK
jgi:hypothetical protein